MQPINGTPDSNPAAENKIFQQEYISDNIILKDKNCVLTDFLVRGSINVTNGNIYLENSFVVKAEGGTECLIKCCNGLMQLSNITVKGDIQAVNGSINVRQSKGFSLSPIGAPVLDVRAIKTQNGDIRLARVRAASLQAQNGRVELRRHSSITGNVRLNQSLWLDIKNARIDGTLETSGKMLFIGRNAHVHRIVFKLDASANDYRQHQPGDSSVQVFGDDTPDCGTAASSGAARPAPAGITSLYCRIPIRHAKNILLSHRIHQSRQSLAGPIETEEARRLEEQKVVLREGAVLRELIFEAPRCTLILLGSARYKGDHAAAGLRVRQEPSTHIP